MQKQLLQGLRGYKGRAATTRVPMGARVPVLSPNDDPNQQEISEKVKILKHSQVPLKSPQTAISGVPNNIPATNTQQGQCVFHRNPPAPSQVIRMHKHTGQGGTLVRGLFRWRKFRAGKISPACTSQTSNCRTLTTRQSGSRVLAPLLTGPCPVT